MKSFLSQSLRFATLSDQIGLNSITSVNSMAARLDTQLKSSHVLRSTGTFLLNSEANVDRRAGEVGGMTRPPNGDLKGLQT